MISISIDQVTVIHNLKNLHYFNFLKIYDYSQLLMGTVESLLKYTRLNELSEILLSSHNHESPVLGARE